MRRVRYGGVPYFEIEVEGRRVTIAEWMTVRDECVGLECGFDPVCSLEALLGLQAFLEGVQL